MINKKFSWLFFDADNTLFDFDGSSQKAFYTLVSEWGLRQPEELYAEYKKWNALVWHQFEQGEIDSTTLRSKRFKLFFNKISVNIDPHSANAEYLNQLVKYANLLPGALDLLNALKSKNKNLLIITNGLKEVQKPRIQKVGISHFFKEIIVSDEIGVAKPDEAFFMHASNSVSNPKKEEVLVIGDSLNSDIKGGNNFGYTTCWFNPNEKKNESEVQPDIEIKSLSEILKYV